MKSHQINTINNPHKISVAPMMDCTDKHFRMIIRKISSKALLYTEMIVAQSLISVSYTHLTLPTILLV